MSALRFFFPGEFMNLFYMSLLLLHIISLSLDVNYFKTQLNGILKLSAKYVHGELRYGAKKKFSSMKTLWAHEKFSEKRENIFVSLALDWIDVKAWEETKRKKKNETRRENIPCLW